jgi:hypothetical protein
VPIHSISDFYDYSGTPNSYEEGIQYFLGKFTGLNKNPDRGGSIDAMHVPCSDSPHSTEIFYHVTNAVNTENINIVFKACQVSC